MLRDVCEESTFCCVSASARQLHRYCYLHLLSSFQHLSLWEESQAPPESEPPIQEITFDPSYSQLI